MDGCRVACMALDRSRMQVKNKYYPALPLVCAEQVGQEARRRGAVFVGDELSLSPRLPIRRVVYVRERRLHLPAVVH